MRGSIKVKATWPNALAEERLSRVKRDLDPAILAGVSDATKLLHQTAVRTINRRTGETAKKVYKVVKRDTAGNPVGTVGTDDVVAKVLEFGSKAHIIRPTAESQAKAKAAFMMGERRTDQAYLRFKVGGRVVYATEVHHPGTRPYLWLKRAFELEERRIVATIDRHVRRAIEGA